MILDFILNVGTNFKNVILGIASLLKTSAAPGLISLCLILWLVIAIAIYFYRMSQNRRAVEWMKKLIAETSDHASFSNSIANIENQASGEAKTAAQHQVLAAWSEYRETFVPHDEGNDIILRNSTRPTMFFNVDDLGFSPGYWRIQSGLFVTIGLFLTFLGLISALNSMDLSAGQVENSLKDLLTIASAKFIMSLTGLFCSILFTITLRYGTSKIEQSVHSLCGHLEKRLTFISLEALAVEQLGAMREQREHFRMIGLELVAELARPLREELPQVISQSISSAMSPVLDKVGKIGADGMGAMVNDLSSRFSDDVGRALTSASDKLVQAGDRIASLSDRMDQSSGKVGIEIDGAVNRLSQAVDDLRNAMGATADTASSAFTKGAEQLLSVMNETLVGIRDNTGEGARALSAAAAEMRTAAEVFRNELDAAAKKGADAAQQQMFAAGQEVAGAVGSAGRSLIDAMGRTSSEIAEKTEQFASKAAEQLLAPIDDIVERLDQVKSGLMEAGSGMQRLADGVRGSADAAQQASGTFRASSQELVAAIAPLRGSTEAIETSIRQLTSTTQNIADTVRRSTDATAESVEQALTAANDLIGGERDAMRATLEEIRQVLERLKGEGAKLDTIDEKLGQAFDMYRDRVSAAVDGLFGHVRQMQDVLAPALDTLRSIVEQAEQFAPESRAKK